MASSPLAPRRAARRRLLLLSVPILVLAAIVALAVAWQAGAFESRISYWRDRGQDCGTIAGDSLSPYDPASAERAAACFAAAQARCKPATLTRKASLFLYVFVVEPRDGGGCDVGVHSEDIFTREGTKTVEAQCASATWNGSAITFHACGDLGDLTVPPQP